MNKQRLGKNCPIDILGSYLSYDLIKNTENEKSHQLWFQQTIALNGRRIVKILESNLLENDE
jgi:hypothetical protein